MLMAPGPNMRSPYDDATNSYDQLDKSNTNLLAKAKSHNMPIETILEKCLITSLTWDRECHGLYDFDL